MVDTSNSDQVRNVRTWTKPHAGLASSELRTRERLLRPSLAPSSALVFAQLQFRGLGDHMGWTVSGEYWGENREHIDIERYFCPTAKLNPTTISKSKGEYYDEDRSPARIKKRWGSPCRTESPHLAYPDMDCSKKLRIGKHHESERKHPCANSATNPGKRRHLCSELLLCDHLCDKAQDIQSDHLQPSVECLRPTGHVAHSSVLQALLRAFVHDPQHTAEEGPG